MIGAIMKNLLLLLLVFAPLEAKEQQIVFAAGCFWGVEKHFENLDGVTSAVSGYAGGNYANPTYKQVTGYRYNKPKNIINHTESVEVKYDDAKISTRELIKSFWELHDPTQVNGQGNDLGDNYRSAIFYTTDTQHKIAISTRDKYQLLLAKAGFGKIVTQIKRLDHFYPAEPFHQDYLDKNPNGYCPNHQTGVKFVSPHKPLSKSKYISPLGGKEIVVIDADECPYCKKFDQDVSSMYKGDIPMRTAHSDMLKGFDIQTDLSATPTILFIKDGKEIYSYRGYLSPKEFYRLVGEFILGRDSEAFKVAFDSGTDVSYCKQYDIFKNTPDGVFKDKISGDILFDTKDRFNSGSGWLSFFKAVDGSTVEIPDNRFGMKRVEVRAKKSGIHLGHVFEDAPGGRRRFCINATVLDFVPNKDR